MRILVLAGGYSPERDVSLTSGSLIANALVDEGHEVCLADVYLGFEIGGLDIESYFNDRKKPVYKVERSIPDLAALKAQSRNGEALIGRGIIELCRAADVVFLALHGAMGENGQLQATLDNYGIKYTGSGYVGSLLAMDKDISKKMFVGAGVNTPEWLYYDRAADCNVDEIEQKIGYPCVVKPCSCGSSVGISLVDDRAELCRALELAAGYEDKILVERKIEGRELTVGILDGEVLPIIEIIPTEGFYDYTNKYQAGKTLEICPAEIDEAIRDAAAQQTRLAFDALRLSGYSRFDFIVDKDGKPWCLEANTLPGMTPTSLLPQMAAANGISYGKLCCKIVELALHK
ncbi:MAG: D-alanine--D-alanine ligase [Clostridia bacterium]|nr:D-alanine--D-alanine ligase [Clostridia bacterium]